MTSRLWLDCSRLSAFANFVSMLLRILAFPQHRADLMMQYYSLCIYIVSIILKLPKIRYIKVP